MPARHRSHSRRTSAGRRWLAKFRGQVIVKGDAGDTAGHCAAGGIIYIGGRAGTRSGSLMKRDPLCEPPELWVLRKAVGSFSFEFMGGGCAVVCGHDSQTRLLCLDRGHAWKRHGWRHCLFSRALRRIAPRMSHCCPWRKTTFSWLDKGLENFLSCHRQNRTAQGAFHLAALAQACSRKNAIGPRNGRQCAYFMKNPGCPMECLATFLRMTEERSLYCGR